jgi:hypothetical protein
LVCYLFIYLGFNLFRFNHFVLFRYRSDLQEGTW